MKAMLRKRSWVAAMALAGAVGILASCQSMAPSYQQVALAGSNEVPPVTTPASGTATVTIYPNLSMNVRIIVTGMTATAAHLHEGAAGANGPVIVPFIKTLNAENTFYALDGAKLTEGQYTSYKAGNLYVNVHSAKNSNGEVRVQLKGN